MPKKYFKIIGSLILFIVMIVTLYAFFSMRKNNLNNIYKEYLFEKNKWNESEITNYQFRIRNHWAIGMGNALNSVVIVKDGEYFDEYNIGTEDYMKNIIRDWNEEYKTIDSIYEYLKECFDFYKNEKIDFIKGYCKNIVVKFDKDNHIPIAIIWEFWHNPIVNISDRLYYTAIYIEDFIIE